MRMATNLVTEDIELGIARKKNRERENALPAFPAVLNHFSALPHELR